LETFQTFHFKALETFELYGNTFFQCQWKKFKSLFLILVQFLIFLRVVSVELMILIMPV